MTTSIEIHIVPDRITPIRLQEYGVGIFEAFLTKSAWKKALKKKYITVDDAVATSATFIHGGETIKLIIPEEKSSGRKLILPLQVLFEDEHLAMIRKPGGILVSGNIFKTIANALPQNLKPSTLPDASTPQPVHRLDYATTGILLAGKTRSSIRLLNKMFENKEIQKTYYAVAIGEMEECGKITSEIDDRKALSNYSVRQRVTSKRFGKLNLVQLEPVTGRRHQLRKHLSGIGNPILGDKDHGREGFILQHKGLYLHAASLQFKHPFTGKEINIEDELPRKFKKIFPEI